MRRLIQAFGPGMRARGADGDNSACAWVNLLSVYALSNWPVYGTTSASQAAALSLSQCLRGDFVTSAAERGKRAEGIADHTGHASLAVVRICMRPVDAFVDHAGEGLL